MLKPNTLFKTIRHPLLSHPTHLRPIKYSVIAGLIAAFSSPLLSQTDSETIDEGDEEVLLLDPFEVTSNEDVGYLATSSLSGSRLDTKLRDIAASIQAITPEFMKDVGATDLKKLLLYTTNTEVGGIDGNFYGGNADDKGYARNMLVEPSGSTRIRGLNNADVTRDFFPTDIPIDWYSLSRVDISRGSNSILFGLGSPAGLINNTLKTPNMSQDDNVAELKVDKYGSVRRSLDVGKVIIQDELAVRVVGLYDKAKFRQAGTWNRDRRIYAALRYQPKLLDGVFTRIDLNGEWGKIKGNRPMSTTPSDFLSSWYGPTHKITVANDEYWTSDGFADIENVYVSQTLGGQLWDDHAVSIYSNPTTPGVGMPDGSAPQAMLVRGYQNVNGGGWGSWAGLVNSNWNTNNSNHEKYSASYYADNPVVTDIINNYEAETGNTFTGFGAGIWPTQMMIDGPLADYMKGHNLIGPNKSEFNNFETFNAQITQSYWGSRIGWNFAYNQQSYRCGYTNLLEGLWGMNVISVDINESLRNNNTGNNPNLGRLYTFGEGRGAIWEKERENWRFTAYAHLDAKDFLSDDSLLARIIGDHTLTGVKSCQRYEGFDRNFKLYAWDKEYLKDVAGTDGYATWRGIHYLSDSILDTNSMYDIDMSKFTGLTTNQAPDLTQSVLAYVDDEWTTKDYNLISWENDIDKLYDGVGQMHTKNKSNVFVWQANMLDGAIVPIFGWRQDKYESWSKPSENIQRDDTYNYVLPYSEDYVYGDSLYVDQQNTSWSIALHLKELLKWFNYELPKGTDITLLYNNSNTFQPNSVAVDVYNRQEDIPSGNTEDVSLLVSTFDNKVSFRITKYKTVQKNTTYNGTSPAFNANKAILGRSMDGMMWEANLAGQTSNDRTQPTPEWIVNKWMFGDDYDETIANTPIPYNWQNNPDILNQPLRIRAAALPGSSTYVAQGDIDPETEKAYIAPPLTENEKAYRTAWFKARSDAEWSRPVDKEFWNAMGFTRNYASTWGGFWETTAWEIPQNMKNLCDLESTGTEYELTANPLPNWRITINASKAEAVRSNVLNSWDEYIEKNMGFWLDGGYALNDTPAMDYWSYKGFYDIVQSPGSTMAVDGRLGTQYATEILNNYYQAKATEDQMVSELRKWHVNIITNYKFTEGFLKGLGIGGAYRWMDKSTIGYYPKFDKNSNAWVNDMEKPLYGPTEDYVDVWMSYQRDLTDKINWSIQLNIYNLFPEGSFIPIHANPDGSIASVRIPGETTWSISNVFRF